MVTLFTLAQRPLNDFIYGEVVRTGNVLLKIRETTSFIAFIGDGSNLSRDIIDCWASEIIEAFNSGAGKAVRPEGSRQAFLILDGTQLIRPRKSCEPTPPPEPVILSKNFEITFTDSSLSNFKSSLSPASFDVLENLSKSTDAWTVILKKDSTNQPASTFQEIIDFINLVLTGLPGPEPEPEEGKGLSLLQQGFIAVGIASAAVIGAIAISKSKKRG